MIETAHTIDSLIQELESLRETHGGDTPVVTAHDYGDRCHTLASDPIEEIEPAYLESSAYSNSGFAVTDEEDDDTEFVIVLRAQ